MVAGYAENNGQNNFAAARYTPAGVLDKTFGNNGKFTAPNGGTVVTPVANGNNEGGTSVAVQSNGAIVVVGEANGGFGLVRYTPSGGLDTTFGKGGIVITPVGNEGNAGAGTVVVQSNGKIVVAGYAYYGGNEEFAVARYTASGALDTTFGTGGIVLTPVGDGDAYANGIAVQSNGDIVVGGYAYYDGYEFAVARYTPSGALDTTFGTGGIVLTVVGNYNECYGYGIALQGNGDIVQVGEADNNGYYVFSLVRYTGSGTLDSTFGSGGIVLTDVGDGDDSSATCVAVQSNGDIVAGGWTYYYEDYGYYAFAVARYTSNGSLDSTFGPGGIVVTQLTPYYDYYGYSAASGLVLQSNGNIVLAGYAYYYGWEFGLDCYLGSATPPSSFPSK